MVSQSSTGRFILEIFSAASGVLVCIGRMMSSSFLSIIAVDSFRLRAFLILAGIEIRPNLSILAILCIMPYRVLLGIRFLSVVGGLRIEFSSQPRISLRLNPGHLCGYSGFI